ncbi:MAG: pyridoxine 5'-phosphate synthase [Planctomycetes bacterium]|nr:pyridoxine 5'-phosphate synthase [Planctomycetota bacterium]
MSLLGVNVDHVATIREARQTYEPDPVWGAAEAQLGGADLITIHLRQDRRHIGDRDLRLLRETVSVPLNLEMSLSDEIVQIALGVGPDMVTLVPENRQEVTTEGGLNVISQKDRLEKVLPDFHEKSIPVSLFIDAEPDQIEMAASLEADFVELHTGPYANGELRDRDAELETLVEGAQKGREAGLTVNAGHGLTYNNVAGVVRAFGPHELHIGHSIVARSVFTGIREAVRQMKEVIHRTEILNDTRKRGSKDV